MGGQVARMGMQCSSSADGGGLRQLRGCLLLPAGLRLRSQRGFGLGQRLAQRGQEGLEGSGAAAGVGLGALLGGVQHHCFNIRVGGLRRGKM